MASASVRIKLRMNEELLVDVPLMDVNPVEVVQDEPFIGPDEPYRVRAVPYRKEKQRLGKKAKACTRFLDF